MFGHLRVCNGARLAALTFLLLRIASPADAAFNIGGRDDKSQNLQRKACPYSCGSDPQPNNWTTYHETDRFTLCEQPLLLDFAVYNPIDNPGTDLTIRACCAGEGVDNLAGSSSLLLPAFHQSGRFSKRDNLTSECGPSTQSLETVYTISWGSVDSGKKDDVVIASQHVRQYFDGKSSCTTGIMFGYVRGVVVGVYAGAKIGNRGAASSLLQNFIDRIQVEGIATSMLAQLCGNDRDSENVFGIIADSTGNFPFVQEAVKSWSDAKCVQGGDATREWEHIQIWSSPTKSTNKTANAANATHPLLHSRELMSRRSHSYAHGHANMHAHDARQLSPRADCRTEKVESGNSCGSLATKCGISGADFTKYNPSSTFCSTLQPGQLVCCSAGTIPDIRPKPDANGSCASYDVQPGDFCQKIASSNGLTLEALNSFNTKTWGWTGCENLQVGIRICLSTGTPPMPAPVANAVCGPTKPGTKAPTGSLQLADLNPCPLKVCCNIWGQCGTTTDFCVASNSSTGAPGTASPGTNGCIQNCGMDIINDKEPPASFSNIAYFEAWNGDRPCLHMDVGDIDTSVYTHVHYSFAEVTPSFQVDISKVTSQFDAFKAMTGIKRILAFGGWTFSTDPATYNIFRQAVTAKNRNTFADNCANFVLLHNLDGVDFDWEYPGAPDIPGIPPGNDDDGSNYLEFLKLVRSKLSSEKSLSIAAPASYWYLKAFPIEDIAKTVTYIVFMTYDLHGQWDYGNIWSSTGCPKGNCLRSHINMTETINGLAMITRAGVKSKQVMVGVSSYGRSFQMVSSSCRGPMCEYVGPVSGAEPGECTGTPGYLANAEIQGLIDAGGAIKTWSDDTQSDYLVYHGTQWVAYMTDANKAQRTADYRLRNFGGTSDWAVDLQQYTFDYDYEPEVGLVWDDGKMVLPDCTGTYSTLEDIANAGSSIPNRCGPLYVLKVLRTTLANTLKTYQEIIDDGYDEKFGLYADAVVAAAPQAVKDFYMKHGSSYFSCEVMEAVQCCGGCWRTYGNNSPRCKYCKGTYDICKNGGFGTAGYTRVPEICPPDTSQIGAGNADLHTIYWTLLPDKKAQFFADLLDETGLAEESIIFTSYNLNPHDCRVYPECFNSGWHFGAPGISKSYGTKNVVNPKDIIAKALKEVQNLPASIDSVIAQIEGKTYKGDTADLVDALGLPVLMVEQAVQSMIEVAKLGSKIAEEKKKALILLIISAILFVIPVFGGALGAINGLATLGRIISLFGEVGFIAMDLYDIVDTPANAPLIIFGAILGAGALTDAAKLSKAAQARRGMTGADLKKLGGGIDVKIGKIDNIIKVCRKK